ncbi:hypothetical protein D3C85_1699140 [compost metagenome]
MADEYRQSQAAKGNFLKYRIGDNKIDTIKKTYGRIAGPPCRKGTNDLEQQTQRQNRQEIAGQVKHIIIFDKKDCSYKQNSPVIDGIPHEAFIK